MGAARPLRRRLLHGAAGLSGKIRQDRKSKRPLQPHIHKYGIAFRSRVNRKERLIRLAGEKGGPERTLQLMEGDRLGKVLIDPGQTGLVVPVLDGAVA